VSSSNGVRREKERWKFTHTKTEGLAILWGMKSLQEHRTRISCEIIILVVTLLIDWGKRNEVV
jgi:hypothetical protein